MKTSSRKFAILIRKILAAVALSVAVARPVAAAAAEPPTAVATITPNGSTLPFTMDNGVKEFHLIAEPVSAEFAPGMVVNAGATTARRPGPTIEAVEGDRVRILVTNKLPERDAACTGTACSCRTGWTASPG